MKIETLANFAEIAGGAAILISLIYVGYQVRQSNRFAKAENTRYIQNSELMDSYNMAVIARGYHHFDGLPIQEQEEFHRYMFKLLNHFRSILETRDMGLLNQGLVDGTNVMNHPHPR